MTGHGLDVSTIEEEVGAARALGKSREKNSDSRSREKKD
jgi:hypothetical protein